MSDMNNVFLIGRLTSDVELNQKNNKERKYNGNK